MLSRISKPHAKRASLSVSLFFVLCMSVSVCLSPSVSLSLSLSLTVSVAKTNELLNKTQNYICKLKLKLVNVAVQNVLSFFSIEKYMALVTLKIL